MISAGRLWSRLLPRRRISSSFAYDSATYASFLGLGPKVTAIRVLWTGASAALGYTGYKMVELSNWFQDKVEAFSSLLPKAKVANGGNGGDSNKGGGEGAALAAFALTRDDESGESAEGEGDSSDKLYSGLIRKMIEVRDVLQAAGLGDKLSALPSIVVIGSQSSGKSSVLESLVGHQFLPKGHNMVTRRPLELTLVHDPTATQDYAVLPGGVKMTSFDQVRRRIAELNEAVPSEQWVSTEPIKLQVHSPRVPDLTLVDLPGYIQVTSRQQPEVLKERIIQLCDSYIAQGNNIILAVSPADVDLANSEAIKASRRVDPLGNRTLGVITKLDLVERQYAEALLDKESAEYPLKLGYIGVVCHGQHKKEASALEGVLRKEAFGFEALQRTLTRTLEHSLAASLSALMSTVREELKECRYQLKVHYNDRCIDEETFVKDFAAASRSSVLQAISQFPRERVRTLLRSALEGVLMELYQQHLWTDELNAPSQISPSILTRHGIGKLASQVISSAMKKEMQDRLEAMAYGNPHTLRRILAELDAKLAAASVDTIDAIENAIKPLKTSDDSLGRKAGEESVAAPIEWEPLEWRRAHRNTVRLLEAELEQCRRDLSEMNHDKLRRAAHAAISGQRISPEATARIQQAVSLQTLQDQISKRLQALPHCQTPECVKTMSHASWLRFLFRRPDSSVAGDFECRSEDDPTDLIIRQDPCQQSCPEVFLYVLAERLVTTATMYAHEELIKGVEHQASGAIALGMPSAAQLVQENAGVARQIQLCRRMRALEQVRILVAYLEQQAMKRTEL